MSLTFRPLYNIASLFAESTDLFQVVVIELISLAEEINMLLNIKNINIKTLEKYFPIKKIK